jgi:hypothetical protein
VTRSRGSKAGLREIGYCTLLDWADQYCSVLHTCNLPGAQHRSTGGLHCGALNVVLKPWGVAGGTSKRQFYLGVLVKYDIFAGVCST